MALDALRRCAMNAEKVTAATVIITVANDGNDVIDEITNKEVHKCSEG